MSDIGVIVSLDDQSIEQSKVVLDYTSRDFTAIRSQLVGLAQGLMPEWKTVGEASDFGTLLIELYSYAADVLHFYIDRTASEAFLGTAVRRQSVLYIADMLGYTPIGQQAASVKLFFSQDAEADTTITIPKGSRVHNATNDAESLVVFETNQAVSLAPGATDVEVFATEGVQVRGAFLGVSRGVPNAEFVLADRGVVYNSVSVVSQEAYQVVNWTYVTDLANARPTQSVFTTFIDEDTMTHLVFGDNSSGRIPPVNAQLSVSYRFGKGASANNLAAGEINTLVALPGVDTWAVSVQNLEPPVGGTDPESIDSMRYSIPRSASRLKRRAITLNDFADLSMQVPGVGKSVAYGTVYTAVHVRIAPQEGKADPEYMTNLCLEVETYMADKVIVGSTVYAEPHDPEELWQDVFSQITVHVVPSFNRTAVRAQVSTVVRQVVAFNNVDFGFRVSMGQIYRAVLAVQGVEYADLEWLNELAPVDNTDPEDDDTSTVIRVVYKHDTSTTMGDPGAGKYRRNDALNPTTFAFSATDGDGVAQTFAAVQIGDHFVYSPVSDPQSWMSLVVTVLPTNAGHASWYQVGVAKIDQADVVTPPNNNAPVLFSGIRYTPTPDSLGGVHDIETPELLIPRIEPTEVIELETDYPDMSEEERTHDGLWIKAVGGLPNT
jgi:hypothetical protein